MGKQGIMEYRYDYPEKAYKMCLLFSATDAQLAEVFNVKERAIVEWKTKYPEFKEALINGKTLADADVAKALHQRAVGFDYEEEQIIKGEVVNIKRKEPPETKAAHIWLRNRQPKHWNTGTQSEVKQEVKIVDTPESRLETARQIAFMLRTATPEQAEIEDQEE